MQLPIELRRAIEAEITSEDRPRLTKASQDLTSAYRSGNFSSFSFDSSANRLAYAIARLPATYAANCRVFQELAQRASSPANLTSLLDLGAGPGVSGWAAINSLPLKEMSFVEKSGGWLDLGKRLADASPNEALRSARWLQKSMASDLNAKDQDIGAHDLVVLSYSMGEIEDSRRATLLTNAWKLAKQFLVLIEPGTPRGFSLIADARNMFLEAGEHLCAPCPHENRCPMIEANDWCHFAARVERTAEHRALKGGELGYEDEKFSYLIVSREAVVRAESRIVRHPMKHGGHVKLLLCTEPGIERRVVTRSQKDVYKLARKAEWGDAWPS